MTQTNDAAVPRLRLRGESLKLAFDPEQQTHNIDRLNSQIADLQAGPSGKFSSSESSLETIIDGLRDDIAGLTQMMDTQQAALLLIIANKGSEGEKALDLIGKATRAILQARPQLPQTNDVNLSRISELHRRKEFEEQRDLEAHRDLDQPKPPKQQGRDMGA